MPNTTVLFPTHGEAQTFMKRHPDIRSRICGVGAAECAGTTALSICEDKPDMLILAGIAGAYAASGLKKGDCIIVTRENIADLGTMRADTFVPLPKTFGAPATDNYYTADPPRGRLLPAISNTVTIAGSWTLNPAMRADIENMEGAGFFSVCTKLGIQFAEIRCISNMVGETPDQWIIPQAVEILSETLYDYISGLQ